MRAVHVPENIEYGRAPRLYVYTYAYTCVCVRVRVYEHAFYKKRYKKKTENNRPRSTKSSVKIIGRDFPASALNGAYEKFDGKNGKLIMFPSDSWRLINMRPRINRTPFKSPGVFSLVSSLPAPPSFHQVVNPTGQGSVSKLG